MSPGSTINARELSHALLSQLEWRGTDASGFAYAKRNGETGMHKDHVIGSQLRLKDMPRDADTVLLHTRMSTHGTPFNNDNNHPVSGPEDRIRLVHNGVIYNHDEMRDMLGRGKELPEVDTSVIPAALEEFGVDAFGLLAGYAAVAWLDTETNNTLHLSRPDGSPVSIARLLDGSFVFASTDAILATALKSVGIKWVGNYPDPFMELSDGDYITVTDGIFEQQEAVDWYDDYSFTSSVDYSRITSGATSTKFGSENVTSSSDHWKEPWELEDYDEYDVPGGFDSDGHWRDTTMHVNKYTPPMALSPGAALEDKFYTLDHEGDYQGVTSIEALVEMLRWHADLKSETNLAAEGMERWVNHFADVGEVLSDGSLQSWITFPDYITDWESQAEGGLSFIRHGAGILKGVMA